MTWRRVEAGMRFPWFVVAFLAASPAAADPAPDLVVTWKEGEQSRDSSMATQKLIVFGSKLRYVSTYEGRNASHGPKAQDLEGVVKDPKKLAAALAKLDAIKMRSLLGKGPTHYRLRSGCVKRGRTERCAEVSGDTPDPADLQAVAAVRDALLEGVVKP